MCRMLGIVSRKPAPVDTLLAFRQLADTGRNFRDFGCPQPNPKAGHPDGWGIACIGAEGEFYVRGPGKATADPRYEEFVRRLARSSVDHADLSEHDFGGHQVEMAAAGVLEQCDVVARSPPGNGAANQIV